MIEPRYVLLAWASASLVPWAMIFAARPRLRRALVWSSAFAVPFGLSEVLFAGRYWAPPSLFDLAARVHLDLESFVFLFATGGVAGVVYEAVGGERASVDAPAVPRRAREVRNVALATPALVFPAALVALREPICAGVVAMAAGALARVAIRPDLARKTALGGLLFLAYYLALVGSLVALEPGYLPAVWNPEGALAVRVARVPLSEVLFGATFGAFWSGLYEHFHWTFRGARRQRESAPA